MVTLVWTGPQWAGPPAMFMKLTKTDWSWLKLTVIWWKLKKDRRTSPILTNWLKCYGAKLRRQMFMTRAEVWAKDWAKYSAHFRASFAVQNDPPFFPQIPPNLSLHVLWLKFQIFISTRFWGLGPQNKIKNGPEDFAQKVGQNNTQGESKLVGVAAARTSQVLAFAPANFNDCRARA